MNNTWPILQRRIHPLFNIFGEAPKDPPKPANEVLDEEAAKLKTGLEHPNGWKCPLRGAINDVRKPLEEIFKIYRHYSPETEEAHKKIYEAVKPAIEAGVKEAMYFAFLLRRNEETYGAPLVARAPELAEEVFETLEPLIKGGHRRAIYIAQIFAEDNKHFGNTELAERIAKALPLQESAAAPKAGTPPPP